MPKQSTVDFLDEEIGRLNAENNRLRAFIREIVAIDPKAGGGAAKYFVTADFIARARARAGRIREG